MQFNVRNLLTSITLKQDVCSEVNILKKRSYLLTYLLTPWSRVLLEKLIGSAASQEIP